MKENQTLLQKARAVKRPRGRSLDNPEQVSEMALAWLSDDISFSQVRAAIGSSGSDAYAKLAVGLREAYRQGLLVKKGK